MTNEIRPDSLIANDDDEEMDEAATIIVPNPLTRSSVVPSIDSGGHANHLSSFATPKSSRPPPLPKPSHGRPSLYDRLKEAGALDDVLELAANGSAEAEAPATRSGQAGFAEASEVVEELGRGERESIEELRESDLDLVEDGGALDEEPIALTRRSMPRPIPQPQNAMPSIVLGPGASTRADATERVSRIPSTHPLANTLSPVPAIPPQTASKRVPTWFAGVAALALVGVGVGIGRLQQPSPEEPKFASQPGASAHETLVEQAVAKPPAAASPNVAELPTEPSHEPVGATEPIAAPAPAAPIADAAKAPIAEAAKTAVAEAAKPPAAEAAKTPVAEAAKTPVAEPVQPVAEARSAALDPPQDNEPEHRARRTRETAEPAEVAAVQGPEREVAKAVEVAPAVAADPNLPAQPDREEVVAALAGITAQLASCVGENHGVANVTITVRGQGVVSHALVSGQYAGTPEGSCIARAVKAAQFKPFSDPSIRITYPFQL